MQRKEIWENCIYYKLQHRLKQLAQTEHIRENITITAMAQNTEYDVLFKSQTTYPGKVEKEEKKKIKTNSWLSTKAL